MTLDRTSPAKQKVARRKSAARPRGDQSVSVPGAPALQTMARFGARVGAHRGVRWTAAAILWSGALFLLLALVTFSPADPDPDHARAGTDQIVNWGGVIGAWLSGALYRAFGAAAWLIPVAGAAVGYDLVSEARSTPLSLRLPSLTLLLFGTAAAMALLWPDWTLHGLNGAGWIGRELGDGLIRRYLGVGGLILMAPVLGLAIVGSLGMPALRGLQVGAMWVVGAVFGASRELSIRAARTARTARLRGRRPFDDASDADSMSLPRQTTRSGRAAGPEDESTGWLDLPSRARSVIESSEPPLAAPDPAQRSSLNPDNTQPDLEIDRPKAPPPAPAARQRTLIAADDSDPWRKPDLDLLDPAQARTTEVDEKVLRAKAQILQHKVKEYGVDGHVTAVRPGPVISVYEFKPAPGVKVARIANLEDDLALATESQSVRIVAPIPGRDVVGIEIPNKDREAVALRVILESASFWKESNLLPIGLGKDTSGEPVVADLSAMPHLLVAGATGAGKSVGINTFIVSLLYRHSPRDLRFYMIDPKRLELSFYRDIPHLEGHDVVTDPNEALALLQALVREMEDRYDWMMHARVKNIAGYNKAVAEGRIAPRNDEEARHMPFLVCIVDELADLMMVTRKAIEEPIARLAQMARAAGIHLVLATQRPSVDVLTGLIKANFPTRIAFKVSSKADARVILDQQGAENLLGRGDMLFRPPSGDVRRVHGAFVSEDEVNRVVEFWKGEAARTGTPQPAVSGDLIQSVLDQIRGGGSGGGADAGAVDVDEELLERVIELGSREGVLSTSRIQRALQIGYNRAARLMDALEARGMVGPPEAAGKPRKFIGGGNT